MKAAVHAACSSSVRFRLIRCLLLRRNMRLYIEGRHQSFSPEGQTSLSQLNVTSYASPAFAH